MWHCCVLFNHMCELGKCVLYTCMGVLIGKLVSATVYDSRHDEVVHSIPHQPHQGSVDKYKVILGSILYECACLL